MPDKIVITSADFRHLTENLISDTSVEQGVAIFAGTARTETGLHFLVREVVPISPEDMLYQTSSGRRLRASAFMALAQKALDEGSSLIMAHSHPGFFSTFSSTDDQNEREMMPRLMMVTEDKVPHGTLVMDANGRADARFWEPGSTSPKPIEWLLVTGRPLRSIPTTSNTCQEANAPNMDMYDRQVKMFGSDGQRILADTPVAIIGSGGTGSVTGAQLAYLGVQDFILCDDDQVDNTNLNRLLGATPGDIGRLKVDVVGNMIRRINPNARIEKVPYRIDVLDAARTLRNARVLFVCTDNVLSRAIANDISLAYLIPLIDMGVGIRAVTNRAHSAGGVIHVAVPGENCLQCLHGINPHMLAEELSKDGERRPGYVQGADIERPAVISLNSLIVSQAVTAFIDLVTGCLGLKGSKFMYDMLEGELSVVGTAGGECRFCGKLKSLGDRYGFPLCKRPTGD